VKKEAKQSVILMAYASSIGIAMAVAIFGCFFLGYWLDAKLGTKPYFAIGLLIIGIAAGFRNIYGLMKRFLGNAKTITTQEESEPHGKRPPPKKD
jgi:ATP synthase protein I